MLVATNLPQGIRVGKYALTGAFWGPDHPRDGSDGRKFLGSYVVTEVPDSAFLPWLNQNRESSFIESRAVLWAETEDELIRVISSGANPSLMQGPNPGTGGTTRV